MSWFAVRHVIARYPGQFEERITVWERADAAAAIRSAEEEAQHYVDVLRWAASHDECKLLDLWQSYELDGPPTEGAEVFSLIRRSSLPAEEYIDLFFDTGSEVESLLDD